MSANRACDYVINQQLVDDNEDEFIEGIDGMCIDSKYRGWDSQRVFNDIYNASSDPESGDSQGNESGDGGGQPSPSSQQSDQQPFDEHDWEGAQGMTADEKQGHAKEIDDAIRQGAITAGKMGTGGERTVADLLEPQVNWREVLREFITDTCTGSDYATYNRPNRRLLHTGTYFPSGITEQVDELVLAIDTSGSIGQRELSAFLIRDQVYL